MRSLMQTDKNWIVESYGFPISLKGLEIDGKMGVFKLCHFFFYKNVYIFFSQAYIKTFVHVLGCDL